MPLRQLILLPIQKPIWKRWATVLVSLLVVFTWECGDGWFGKALVDDPLSSDHYMCRRRALRPWRFTISYSCNQLPNDAGFPPWLLVLRLYVNSSFEVLDLQNLVVKTERFEVVSSLARKDSVTMQQMLKSLLTSTLTVLSPGQVLSFSASSAQDFGINSCQVATMYESPVGFRHGPKIIDQRRYRCFGLWGQRQTATASARLDLPVKVADHTARRVVLLSDQAFGLENVKVALWLYGTLERYLPVFLTSFTPNFLPYWLNCWVEIKPDTPSPTGTVNLCGTRCDHSWLSK